MISRFTASNIRGTELVTTRAKHRSELALCLHELTTNAVKCGALWVPEDGFRVEWSHAVDGRVSLRWSERGGPLVIRRHASHAFP
jgi:two-component sensor histidine kinase